MNHDGDYYSMPNNGDYEFGAGISFECTVCKKIVNDICFDVKSGLRCLGCFGKVVYVVWVVSEKWFTLFGLFRKSVSQLNKEVV